MTLDTIYGNTVRNKGGHACLWREEDEENQLDSRRDEPGWGVVGTPHGDHRPRPVLAWKRSRGGLGCPARDEKGAELLLVRMGRSRGVIQRLITDLGRAEDGF